jgi:hypothetical protein
MCRLLNRLQNRLFNRSRARSIICSALMIILLAACNLVPAETTPIATPDLPRVEFLSPPNRATVVEGALLDVDIVAQDETAGIAKVEFFVDGSLLQTGATESADEEVYRVTMNWLAEGIGNHSLSAIAYRPTGIAGQETTIIVEVVSDGASDTDSNATQVRSTVAVDETEAIDN